VPVDVRFSDTGFTWLWWSQLLASKRSDELLGDPAPANEMPGDSDPMIF